MVVIGGRAHTLKEIEQVGAMGFPYAEINIDDPQQTRDQMADLLALKEQYGLYYLAHYPNEGNPRDIENLRRRFIPKMKALLDLSKPLGIRKGTMHFWMDQRWAEPDLIRTKVEMLSELVEHAAELEVLLCLENLTARHESFITFFERIPGLRMTMDIGHGELLSKHNTAFGFMQHVFSRIAHVHVHDNLGGTSVKDDLHLALGDGIVDYPGILTILREKGYDSTITLEVKPNDMPRTQMAVRRYI
jgi:sugar phosphate isomerase/epimerase